MRDEGCVESNWHSDPEGRLLRKNVILTAIGMLVLQGQEGIYAAEH